MEVLVESGNVDVIIDALTAAAQTGSIGDGTSYLPITGSGPRGGIDGDPSEQTGTDDDIDTGEEHR